MIYEKLNSWYLLQIKEETGYIGLVLHTSCVNYCLTDLERLRKLPFSWIVPDNVYWELKLLQQSSIYGLNATFILDQVRKETHKSWNLEQLYEDCADSVDPSSLYEGTLVFVFGDLNKQDEFLGHIPDLPMHYIFVSEGWSCLKSEARVYSLRNARRWSMRKVKTLSHGISVPPVETLQAIQSSGTSFPVFSGRDLDVTAMCGSYARIYTCSFLPGKYIKFYKGQALIGNQIKKLENLCKIAKQAACLPLALPECLLYVAGDAVVGYTMKQCTGRSLREFISIGWEGHDLKLIFRRLALLLLELHNMHMMVNDLSYNNILIDEEDQVYIVDCDSFQVFHYPGGGITEIYRHPEIPPDHYHDLLREPRHEYFAFAVLIFQCLFFDDPLRQIQERDDDRILNWNNAVFPLDTSENSFCKANRDILKLWNLQEYDLRKIFADEFHFRSDNSIGVWIRILDLLD